MNEIKELAKLIEYFISNDVKSPIDIRGTFTDYGVGNITHSQKPMMGYGKMNQFEDDDEEEEKKELEDKVKISKVFVDDDYDDGIVNEVISLIEEFTYEEKLFKKIRNPFQTN